MDFEKTCFPDLDPSAFETESLEYAEDSYEEDMMHGSTPFSCMSAAADTADGSGNLEDIIDIDAFDYPDMMKCAEYVNDIYNYLFKRQVRRMR